MDLRRPAVQRAAALTGNFTWVALGLAYVALRAGLATDPTRLHAILLAGVAGSVVVNAPLVAVVGSRLARGPRDGVAPLVVSVALRLVATGLFAATVLRSAAAP